MEPTVARKEAKAVTLTDLAAERMTAPKAGRRESWDRNTPGLFLRISASGAKRWMVKYRMNGQQKKAVLGIPGVMKVDEARKLTRDIIQGARGHIDVVAKLREPPPPPPPPPLTVAGLIDRFIEEYAKPKNRTAPVIAQQLRKHVAPSLGDRPADAVTRRDIEAIRDKMIAAGHGVQANRVTAMVKKLYSWAVKQDLLAVNPAANVELKGEETIRRRVLDDWEMKYIWRAADAIGGANGALVKLLMLTGQRRGEIAKMRWGNLDLNYEIAVVDHNASTPRIEKHSSIAMPLLTLSKEQTKAQREHQLPIPYAAMPIILQQPRDCSYVLSNDGNSSVSGFSKLKRRLDEKIKELALQDSDARTIEPWILHDLRRTLATRLYEMRIPALLVSDILNHAVIGVTRTVYIQAKELEDRLNALNQYGQRLQKILWTDAD